MCSYHEWISCGIAIVSIIVSSLAIVMSHITQKRYVAGNVQIVKEILDPVVLEQVTGIIAAVRKMPNGQDNTAFMLYLNNQGKYSVVNKTFQDLNMVCALIYDKALPAKFIICAKESIGRFLSRGQILDFAKAQKDTYPELNSLANELTSKSRS